MGLYFVLYKCIQNLLRLLIHNLQGVTPGGTIHGMSLCLGMRAFRWNMQWTVSPGVAQVVWAVPHHLWVQLSHVQLFATPWATACQAPLSMKFSKQEYWSGLLYPPAGDLPNPGIQPRSPALQADSLLSEWPGKLYSHYLLLFKIYNISLVFTLKSIFYRDFPWIWLWSDPNITLHIGSFWTLNFAPEVVFSNPLAKSIPCTS